MKVNVDLNQIVFECLVEYPRKQLGLSIRMFCADSHVGTATYSKAKKKKSINPQSLSRLLQSLCFELDEEEFMEYGKGLLREMYRAMRGGKIENI